MPEREGYIPALTVSWLTPVYDWSMRWIFRENVFKPRLVEQARLSAGHTALDLGCGTGTLSLLLARAAPTALVVGLDGDRKPLARAKAKIARSGVSVPWVQGTADRLPFRDRSFERVVSSLVFHHLTRHQKEEAAREILRILRPDGEFHLLDLGVPQNAAMRLASLVFGRLEHADDNVRGRIPGILRDAGFDDVEPVHRFMTPMGTVQSFRARRVG